MTVAATADAPPPAPPLLEVRDLVTRFATDGGAFNAVDGVSFALAAGEVLGIVGESGCGKSVTALSLMRLVARPAGAIAGGSVAFQGRDLLALPEAAMRDLRGDRMAMIFQEPMTALNPVLAVGAQVGEALRRHRGLDRAAARAQAVELLRRVGIPAAERRVDDFPHRLSGGMRQRAMIAMALACAPDLLIADEPTTALDVTIQAQILDLIMALRAERGMAVLLITHDLGVVAETADRVLVMYAGRVVEQAPVASLFRWPQHPYTIGLLGAIPHLGDARAARLANIEGTVPHPLAYPAGCRFAPRCPFAEGRCHAEAPPLVELAPGHAAACWQAPLA